MTATLHPLRRAVQPLVRRAAPDAELVARFVAERDQPAFAELVRRHGPAVLAVCRHVTRHHHHADDTFQATFLVLAKKAHALDPAARGLAAGGGGAGRQEGGPPPADTAAHGGERRPADPRRPDGEAVAAVRAAVAALPVHQRQAVERCELLGRPRAEVAGELGIPPGTLSSRLALARRALAARLTRQGFAPVVVPAALLKATASEVSSRRVVELAEAVMRVNWHGWAAGLVLAMGAAVGVASGGVQPRRPDAIAPTPAAKANEGRMFFMDHTAGKPAFVWLDPDGGQPLRLAEADLRAVGADLTQQLALGIDLVPRLSTMFQTAGVVRPNGEL